MAGLTIEVLLKSAWPMHNELGFFTMSAIIRRGNFPRERYVCSPSSFGIVHDTLLESWLQGEVVGVCI